MNFPKYDISMTIEHNDHKGIYQSAEEWIADNDPEWKDDESKRRAIEADSIWTMRWYPISAGGFYYIAAPTFEELLELANK